jgi:hypothetical protein
MKQVMVGAGWCCSVAGWFAILYILAMWLTFGPAEYSYNLMELILDLVPSLFIVISGAGLIYLGRYIRRRFRPEPAV